VAFKDRPIRRKLTALFLATSGVAVLMTCAAYLAAEFVTFRQSTLEQLSTLGDVVAANSTAAMAFSNERDAENVLASLQTQPHIVAAALYDVDGALFAKYPATLRDGALPTQAGPDGYSIDRSFAATSQAVSQGRRRLGTIYIKSDLEALYSQLRLDIGIMGAVVLTSFTVAFVVAWVLQRQISEPVLALASTAHVVASGDYSVRASKSSNDELGVLTDAFNSMLAHIEQQDRELRETDERLNMALSSSGIGTWSWDLLEQGLVWDDHMHPLYGLTPGSAPSRVEDAMNLTHPDDREHSREALAAALERDELYDVERRVIWPDGTVRVLASRGKVFRDDTGRPARMTGVTWDVTERRRSEEVRQQLAAIIESAADPILSKDLDGTIRSWNAGATRLFGYTADEIVGQPVTRLIPEDRLEEEARIVEQLGNDGQVQPFDSIRRRKDGTLVPVSLQISPIKDRSGNTIGASNIIRDITELKHIEAQLRTTVVDLERSNRELEQFASVASHDLQEPLRMVSSYTQLLEAEFGHTLDGDAREYMTYAVDGAKRMHRLINALLDYSRVGTRGTRPEPVDANAVMRAVRANLSVAIADANATVVCEPLPTVLADATQLAQLLQNLIANALKFRGSEPPHVCIRACDRPDEWVFSVRDNGIGIEPQYFEKIFVIFQRLHAAADYPGTGIGLAVCKRIAERHGGRIWVESEYGSGATFYFSLSKSLGA
jgi:PAS domain S-box-containing protein